jgi:hypothetical protein
MEVSEKSDLQYFAHRIISSAQDIENKTKNFDADFAPKKNSGPAGRRVGSSNCSPTAP